MAKMNYFRESGSAYCTDLDRVKNAGFHHPPIKSKTQIRLLRIATVSEDPNTSSYCLETVNVSDLQTVKYAAFSYCWGEARTYNDIQKTWINDQPFWIRTNLWTFLQSLQRGIRMPVYIDAICLNQLDNKEKGHQVQLMSQVYSNANHTHVWLGSPHWEQDLNLRILRSQLSGGTSSNSQWQPEAFLGLSYICSRNYWHRLWIVQEVLLSKHVTLHCGAFNFIWDEIAKYAKHPPPEKFYDNPDHIEWWDAWSFPRPQDVYEERAIEERLFGGWHWALRLFHHRRDWRNKCTMSSRAGYHRTSGIPFHHAIQAFRLQQCQDQRDRIYGLLGLLDDQGKNMIAPDYTCPLENVYVQAAAAGIISCRSTHTASQHQSQEPPLLSYEERMYCYALNEALGLPEHGLASRMTTAGGIADSYCTSEPQTTKRSSVHPRSLFSQSITTRQDTPDTGAGAERR